jgi:DNA ligase-associated metallophosphoesterase
VEAINVQAVRFAGIELLLDLSGALYWPAKRVLAVADLHLEKGSGYGRSGQLLPPYDTTLTLRRLAAVIQRLRPRIVLALGDSFHDKEAPARLSLADAAVLRSLTGRCDFIWIDGNHDPQAPLHLGGRGLSEWGEGKLRFRHQPEAIEQIEIVGHFHPVAALSVRGRGMRRRCFAIAKKRMVLPAFGAYVGGLNVLDRAFAPVLGGGCEIFALGRQRLHRLAPSQLRPDPPPLRDSSPLRALGGPAPRRRAG